MGTLTADDRTRVRTYFDALLPGGSVDDAVATVAERVAGRRDVAVLTTAHDVLHERGRVAPEVEIDVLVQEVGLSPAETAQVVGVEPADVRRALEIVAGVAAELGLERDVPPVDVPEAPPAAARPEEAPPEEAPPEEAPPEEAPPVQEVAREEVRAPEPAAVEASAPPAHRPEAPSRRGPILAIFAVFAIIAALVVVASTLA